MGWLGKGWQRLWPGLLLAGGIAGLIGAFGGSPGEELGWHRPPDFDEAPLQAVAQAATAGPERSIEAPARNLILVFADGFGFGQLLAGRAAVHGSTANPLPFERWPVHTTMTTHAPGLVITDSSAAASTMATGVKVPYRGLSACPDGRPLRSITEALAEAGFTTLVATDTSLVDATPAAFAGHAATRVDYQRVAETMAASPVDLLAGVGDRGLAREAEESWRPYFLDRGFSIVEGMEELQDQGGRTVLLGDREGDELTIDGLAEALLPRLEATEAPFFLLLETEEPDTASHRYDLERLQRAVERLVRAVEILEAWAAPRGDTLLVVSADHETSGLVPTGGRVGEPLRITWGAGYHSALPVPLWAIGPGAGALESVRDNLDFAPAVARGLGRVFTPDDSCPAPP